MHETQSKSYDVNANDKTVVECFQGSYDELKSYLDTIPIGSITDGKMFVNGSLSRQSAGRGVLNVTYKTQRQYCWWGFGFSEISKPIKTWLALKIEDPSVVATEINKIDLWEQQKANGGRGTSNYLNFRYSDTGALDGFALALAKKIHQGIDSYSIYTPVATCTRTQLEAFSDSINSIGTYRTSLSSPGPVTEQSRRQLEAFSQLRPFWLKTTDEISNNSDGSFTRREAWTGLDIIDTDLYKQQGQQ